MTLDQLQQANQVIEKVPIKGKNYAMVCERVQALKNVMPNSTIETEIISMENGIVTMKATVFDEDGHKLGTGHAQEKEDSSFINQTSYIENCETSAVGRALGMCGIGVDKSFASAEELANALINQEIAKKKEETKEIKKAAKNPNELISEERVMTLLKQCDKEGISEDEVCEKQEIESFRKMTLTQNAVLSKNWSRIVDEIKKSKAEKADDSAVRQMIDETEGIPFA